MDAKESLVSAIARFRTMAGELGQFMTESEQSFLAIGGSLQHLEDEANRVLTESSGHTRMATGDSDPAERLRRGVGELDRHLERSKAETEKGLGALTVVLAGIDKLSRLDGDFQLIVATLHALASTTHLENSRRNTSQDGFDSVVRDLRNMAREIKPKFGEVLSHSRDVRSTAASALSQAHGFLDRHRREAASFRQDTQRQLAGLSDACRTAQDLADKSTDSMTSLRGNVGQVLQSLQVQDLARQMLEHVVQDLDEFARGAQAAMDADGSLPTLRSWLAELAVVSRLQSAQLGNACDRLVRGLSQIDSSLQAIVSTLSLLAKKSADFSGKTLGTSVFTQLERSMRLTTETLRAHDAQADAMLQALAKVCETAVGIGKLVDEVAWLGKDARFIGLNAMVKAVRVGQAGATLTVLAREIETVSDQVQAFTASATSIMESVGQQARALVDARGQSDAKVSGEQVAGALERLMGELGTYQTSLASAVDILLSSSDALRREVSATSQRLHDLVARAKQVRLLSYELGSLHNSALADARGAKPPAGRSHDENQHHTMEEERQVQRAALGGAAIKTNERSDEPADVHSAEGSVEFF